MPAKVEILDMIEEGNRVAVRWQVSATARNSNPYEGSCVASIALRTDASPRIRASLLRHFGRDAIRRTQVSGSDQMFVSGAIAGSLRFA
jgi:hypothetical protein